MSASLFMKMMSTSLQAQMAGSCSTSQSTLRLSKPSGLSSGNVGLGSIAACGGQEAKSWSSGHLLGMGRISQPRFVLLPCSGCGLGHLA